MGSNSGPARSCNLSEVLRRDGECGVIDWPRLLWAARNERVLLKLLAAIDETPAIASPGDVRADLRELRYVTALTRLARGAEIATVQSALANRGVGAISLSSCAFCAAGHDRGDQRELGDTTPFLVRSADVERAASVVTSLGYAPDLPAPDRLVGPMRSAVSVSAMPGWMRRLGPSAHAVPAEFFDRAIPVRVGDHDVLTLARADWLLHICAALGPAVRRFRFGAAMDIVRLINAADDQELTHFWAAAQRLGIGPRVAAAVISSFRSMKAAMPEWIDRRFSERCDRFRLERLAESRAGSVGDVRPIPRRPAGSVPGAGGTLGAFAPTPDSCVRALLDFAEVGPADVVYDLGCGDGRIVRTAVSQWGARGVGVDIDPERIAESIKLARGLGDRAVFILSDVADMSLTDATVVCLYVTPSAMDPLLTRLFRELRPGARIVSHNGASGHFVPDQFRIVRSDPFSISSICVWVVPDYSSASQSRN